MSPTIRKAASSQSGRRCPDAGRPDEVTRLTACRGIPTNYRPNAGDRRRRGECGSVAPGGGGRLLGARAARKVTPSRLHVVANNSELVDEHTFSQSYVISGMTGAAKILWRQRQYTTETRFTLIMFIAQRMQLYIHAIQRNKMLEIKTVSMQTQLQHNYTAKWEHIWRSHSIHTSQCLI